MLIFGFLKSAVLGPIMSFGKYLLANPKALMVFLVAAAISYGAWKINHHVKELKFQITVLSGEKAELETKVATLKNDIAVAKKINDENQAVLDRLKSDLNVTQSLIAEARNKAATHKKRLDELEAKLKNLEDGPVAQVLRAAVEGVQLERDLRHKEVTP